MTNPPVCSKCKTAVPVEFINAQELRNCPACKSEIEVEIFPSFFRPLKKGSVGETLVVDSHASCFYHPQKQAAVVCVTCGRFICSLCDVEMEGQHLCPPCLETAQKTGKIKSLENRRVLHDTVAFHLALLSILVFYVSFITAPLAFYWAVRYRKAPASLLHRSNIRRFLALLISSLLILAWVGVIVAIFFRK